MIRKVVPLGIVLIVAAIVAAYLMFSDAPVGEMVEAAAEGGERILRDPMRPAAGGPRVLLIGLDGVGADDLQRAIENNELPTLAALVGAGGGDDGLYEHAWMVPGALSVLPSTTLAAWTSIFTGEPPARTGVPGNEWFDRATATYYAPAPVSVSGVEQALEVYTESMMDDVVGVPTVYEQAGVRSYVSLSQIQRGADLLTIPDMEALGDLFVSFAEGVTEGTEVKQEIYEDLDRLSIESLLDSYAEYGIPDLQVVYFPGIDLYTHVAVDPIESQHRYLREVTEPALATLIEAYRGAGVLDETYIVFIADHGHIPVAEDSRHALDVEDSVDPPAVLEQVGFRLRPFELEIGEDEQDYQATLAYQGAFAYVYLADRSVCPEPGQVCDWRRPPRLEEDVLTVVRAFADANQPGSTVPEIEGSLDLIFAREPRPAGEDDLPFQVWDGEGLVDIDAYLADHPRPDLIDLKRRLDDLGAGPYGDRAGDVLLMAKSGIELPIQQRFYFSHSYRSWHGSATGQDSRIPFLVISPAQSGEQLRDRVSGTLGDPATQLDVVPVVLELLERAQP